METMFIERVSEVKKAVSELTKKLTVRISLSGRKIEIDGESVAEYESGLVIQAVDFGFISKQAMQLLDEEMQFRKISMKEHTKRKDLSQVRARVIGTKGKTKRVLQDISGCDIVIRDNEVGIIGDAESIEAITTAVENLIKGTKQSNIYRYLERMNRAKKDNRF